MSYMFTCEICKKKDPKLPLPCGCVEKHRQDLARLRKGAKILDCVILEKMGPVMWEKLELEGGTILFLFISMGIGGSQQYMTIESEQVFLEECYPELAPALKDEDVDDNVDIEKQIQ